MPGIVIIVVVVFVVGIGNPYALRTRLYPSARRTASSPGDVRPVRRSRHRAHLPTISSRHEGARIGNVSLPADHQVRLGSEALLCVESRVHMDGQRSSSSSPSSAAAEKSSTSSIRIEIETFASSLTFALFRLPGDGSVSHPLIRFNVTLE